MFQIFQEIVNKQHFYCARNNIMLTVGSGSYLIKTQRKKNSHD